MREVGVCRGVPATLQALFSLKPVWKERGQTDQLFLKRVTLKERARQPVNSVFWGTFY